MEIDVIPVGMLQANCYIVTKNNKTVVIDPGDEFEKIKKHCQNKNIVGILLTHDHFDHVGALKQMEKEYNLKHNPKSIEGFSFEVIKNPGHSMDSVSFYFLEEKMLFCGDFIFAGTIGRCDLPGGDFTIMQDSIRKILTYPSDTQLYPGHGPSTILEKEKEQLIRYL